MAALLVVVAFALLCGVPSSAVAQSPQSERSTTEGNTPLRGIVWSEPDNTRDAVRELSLFAKSGVQAVRVDVLQDTLLYAVGDSLGLQFFQELPVKLYPARILLDSIDAAVAMMEAALSQSVGHRSARHFGLSLSSDNSVSEACRYYDTLTATVKNRMPDASTYYLTAFLEDDACTQSVDFVLLDRYATNRIALSASADRFDAGKARAYGIGALGRRLEASDGVGLRQPYSAESQARFFEDNLPRLLAPAVGSPTFVAVFVENWRSSGTPPAGRIEYSIVNGTRPRPAWSVVSGIYSGRQNVFAFPAGDYPANEKPWLAILGLVVVFVLALAYSASPQFRQLVPRYFLSHGFYREAVAQGRDVTHVINGALLTAISLSIGIVGSMLFYAIRFKQLVQTILEWIPDSMAVGLMSLSARPWLMAIVVGAFAALGTLVWISLMSLASRLGRTLSPMQTLMIALWPQWPILLLLPVALVLPTFSATVSSDVAGWLALAAGVLSVWVLIRILLDYVSAGRIPIWVAGIVVVVSPVILYVGTILMMSDLEYLRFLRHLLMRA